MSVMTLVRNRQRSPQARRRTCAPTVVELEARQLLSHFRYGNLSWETVAGVANAVEFHFQFGAREESSSAGGAIAVGDIVTDTTGGGAFDFGDGSSVVSPIQFRVLSVNTAGNYFVAEAVHEAGPGVFEEGLVHTYSSAGNFTAFLETGARIGQLMNNASGSYRIATAVNLDAENASPVSSLPPIVQIGDDAIATFQIPAVDVDGDSLNFRLATSQEAAGGGGYAHPPGLSVSPSGLVTWDVRDSVLSTSSGDLWTTQIIVEALDQASHVKSQIPLDFLLQIVAGAPPVFDRAPTTPIRLVSNQPITFTIQASDPDSTDTVSIDRLNPPAGMTAAPVPAAPGSRANAAAIQVSFTPTPGQAAQGLVVTFLATDASGLTAQTAVTLNPNARTATLEADPATETIAVGKSKTVTATLLDDQGSPLAGMTVIASITSGPNAGITFNPAQGVTDANGRVSFSYPGNGGPGTDQIDVSAAVPDIGTIEAGPVFATWIVDAQSAAPTATVTLNVAARPPSGDTTGPMVASFQRVGFHMQPTLLMLSFSEDLALASATDESNYRVLSSGRDGRFGTADDRTIKVASASYNPIAHVVTLRTARRLDIHRRFQLGVNGSGLKGLTDRAGNLLDGNRDLLPGGNCVVSITRASLAGASTVRRAIHLSPGQRRPR